MTATPPDPSGTPVDHHLPDLTNEAEWTADRLQALVVAVHAERDRRLTVVNAESEFDRLNRQYLQATGRTEGEAWVQPTGAHDAYPKGWKVARGGKPYESLIPANTTEPGSDPRWWKDLTPKKDLGPEPWKQPTAGLPRGSGGPYAKGDRVTFEGATYMSLLDNNVWSPAAYPAGWQKTT